MHHASVKPVGLARCLNVALANYSQVLHSCIMTIMDIVSYLDDSALKHDTALKGLGWKGWRVRQLVPLLALDADRRKRKQGIEGEAVLYRMTDGIPER